MKLVLASVGFYTKEIAERAAKLAGKPLSKLNVAVINEAAAVDLDDKTWFIEEMNRLRKFAGGEIDFINLLALDISTVEKRLEFADVIYVVGGVVNYLLSVYQKTGFDELLKGKLLREKVYVGSSAGSKVLGRRISTGYPRVTELSTNLDYPTTEFMALVDFAIVPHFESPEFPERNTENIAREVEGFDYPVYALKDTQAVIYNDGKIEFVGGEPLYFGKKV